MTRLIAGIVVSVFYAGVAHAFDFTKGDTVYAPENYTLTIKNLEDISATWKYGVGCLTQSDSELTLMGVDGNRVLVSYRSRRTMSNVIWCPDGVIAFMPQADWVKETAETAQRRKRESDDQKDRPIVERLLREYKNK
jgi:hypothetical protein